MEWKIVELCIFNTIFSDYESPATHLSKEKYYCAGQDIKKAHLIHIT